MKMDKKDFVKEVGNLLHLAKTHLIQCELSENEFGEIVKITCENGTIYEVSIEADSYSAIVYDVFKAMMCK